MSGSARSLAAPARPAQHAVPDLVARAIDLTNALEETLQILRSVLPDLPEPSLHGVGRRRRSKAATPANDAMLTTSDVCRILGCDPRTLRRWRHEKKVPRPVRIGGRLRWRRRDLLPWIEKRRAC
jgi:excisionase family DNA binding protein